MSCPICYEEYIDVESRPFLLDSCSHEFCRPCLHTYASLAIQSNRVPLPCPDVNCEGFVEDREIQSIFCSPCCDRNGLVDVKLYQRYREILKEQLDRKPSIRNETNASHSVQGTKPCPHCGASIEKFSGCDHVVCPMCSMDFCFACGTHEYLSGNFFRSCSKCSKSYVDHRRRVLFRLYLMLQVPMFLVIFVFWLPLILLFFVCTGCFCCCFGFGSFLEERKNRGPCSGLSYTGTILFFPLIFAIMEMGYWEDELREMIERVSSDDFASTGEQTVGGESN